MLALFSPSHASPTAHASARTPALHMALQVQLPGRVLEEEARRLHGRVVIGVDDSGQGAIAGPTFAAAVWLHEDWRQSEELRVFDS
eukprot:7380135-Prymnesium_polylepis.1